MKRINYFYKKQLPNCIDFDCYIHEISGYRYNWHNQMYELNIILSGQANFCVKKNSYQLQAGDILLINPNDGHASLATAGQTSSLVLHFSPQIFQPYLKHGQYCEFLFCSNDITRNSPRCECLRFFASQALICTHHADDALLYSTLQALSSLLFGAFQPQIMDDAVNPRSAHQEQIHNIIQYIEKNYAAKITLEEISRYFGYNRTYISTFFKTALGVGFYDYLTKVRFSNAVISLHNSHKTLTQIALENGFPDLKTFNRLFKENFHISPREYREKHSVPIPTHGTRDFRSCEEPPFAAILSNYLHMQ